MHVPADRFGIEPSSIESDGHYRHVVEEGQQDNHDGSNGIEIEDDHRQYHENHDANRFCDAVDCIAVHPFEDPPRLLYRIDYHR